MQEKLGLIEEAADDLPGSGATVQPALASLPRILDAVARDLAEAGVAGEPRIIRLLYLVMTSRLLERPCSVALKGPSASGKSYLVGRVLELFPSSAFYCMTAMSERALAYDPEPLVHRMLVIYEAAGFRGENADYFLRSLLSEGRIDYVTVDKGKGGLTGRRITRDGPTGLITTTTAVNLHPENETRLISLTVLDTPAQTRAVMLANARPRPQSRELEPWHELQLWLESHPADVVIPFAEELADLIPPASVRLRRDFPTLLNLITTHALLHRASRRCTKDGAVVADFEDYEVVRELVADLMADAAERAVPELVRETVQAVTELGADDLLGDGVTYSQVGKWLGVDKSTAQRRARAALHRGFVRNLELGRGRPARLVPGDPLPEDGVLLPNVDALRSAAQSAAEDNDPTDGRYPRGSWLTSDEAEEPVDLVSPLPMASTP